MHLRSTRHIITPVTTSWFGKSLVWTVPGNKQMQKPVAPEFASSLCLCHPPVSLAAHHLLVSKRRRTEVAQKEKTRRASSLWILGPFLGPFCGTEVTFCGLLWGRFTEHFIGEPRLCQGQVHRPGRLRGASSPDPHRHRKTLRGLQKHFVAKPHLELSFKRVGFGIQQICIGAKQAKHLTRCRLNKEV